MSKAAQHAQEWEKRLGSIYISLSKRVDKSWWCARSQDADKGWSTEKCNTSQLLLEWGRHR